VARIPVAQRPNAIAATARDVWITSFRNDTVTRVSASANRVRDARLVIGIGGMDVATGYGSVWFVNSLRRELTRASAASGQRRGQPLVLPLSPVTVDAGAGAVWVGAVTPPANTAPSMIYRVDRRRMRVTDAIPVPGTVRSLATGSGAVWFVADRALYRIAVGTRRVRRIVAVGRESTVTVGAGAVWVASRRAGKVLQVEIPSERVVTIPMRGAPSHIAIANGAVWVSNYGAHTLTRIDPRTSTVVPRPIRVGRNPLALAGGEHAIWATVVADNSVVRVGFR
jgi:streptogramin lyase